MHLVLLSLAIAAALLAVQPANAQHQGGYERCYRESRNMGYSHAQASKYCARYPKADKK